MKKNILLAIFVSLVAGGSIAQANNGMRVKSPRPAVALNAEKKTDAELVAESIIWGDCAFLYEYTKKEGADKNLVTQANNAIQRYTGLDANGSKYRTRKMDARVRRVPKELIDQVFTNPKANLPGVVSTLVNGVSDTFLKTKILHDWICDNIAYDADMYFSGRITNQDYESVLKKKKAVCSGYTNLMNQMCELAGIESIGINGYSKGFGYSGKIGKNTDHTWNAVKIGNKWYLVDVTWDAGPLERKTFIKRYSTAWLFMDSRPFLYSHLPEENAYQYYAPILTADEFMKEAYISGTFFQYGLALVSEYPQYNNSIDGIFGFDIALKNSNVSVSSELTTQSQSKIDAAAWAERKSSTVTFDFDVPDASQYKGNIYARYSNESNPQDKIAIGTFERDYLPRAEALFNTETPKDRKITEKELEYFRNSYFKVVDNGSYYFLEDQFDVSRNNAVLKIHKLLDIPTTMMENVLNFNIQAASGYHGFGIGVLKYPFTFETYNRLPNTRILSPLTGTLQVGDTVTFVVSSKDYASFAIIVNSEWNIFVKNNTSGNYELSLTIPDGIDSLKISGSTARTGTYWGLVQYNVVP